MCCWCVAGNFIVDCDWGAIDDPASLNAKLIAIPGVIETGLFVDMCERVYFGQQNGTVTIKTRKPKGGGSNSARGSGGAESEAATIAASAAAGGGGGGGSPSKS